MKLFQESAFGIMSVEYGGTVVRNFHEHLEIVLHAMLECIDEHVCMSTANKLKIMKGRKYSIFDLCLISVARKFGRTWVSFIPSVSCDQSSSSSALEVNKVIRT